MDKGRRTFTQALGWGGLALKLGVPSLLSGCSSSYDVKFREDSTDGRGLAELVDEQTGLPVRIFVEDENGNALSGVNVTYLDSDFDAVSLRKRGYTRHFEVVGGTGERKSALIARKESSLEAAVNLNFTLYSGNGNDYSTFNVPRNRQQVLLQFEDWALSDGYNFSRCMTREELVEARDQTMQLISWIGDGGLFSKLISAVYDGVIKLNEWGLAEDLPNDAFFYVFEPRNPTLPPLIIGSSRTNEIPENIRNRCGENSSGDGYIFNDEF